jgi:transposase-like protein
METNLVALYANFGGNESACRNYLAVLRWPKGVECPRCQTKTTVSEISTRGVYDCDSCRYQFSVTAGTIFNDTHLPLWKWFLAIYLMCEGKKGISANQLGRSIKVSYKTAWYLCHRIRKAMSEVNPAPIGGVGRTVKMDEKETTKPDTSRIYTDDNPGYNGIADADTEHHSVNQSAEELVRGWVRGDVSTNGIEGVWSLFKRSIVGSHHQVSAKHLVRYLDEFEWRFNQRENPFLFRDTLTRLVQTEKMEYRKLIS